MFCENCGKQLPEGAKFCLNCGAKVEAAAAANTAQEESAVAADVAENEAVNSAVAGAGSETAQASGQQAAQAEMPQAAPVQPEPEKRPPQAAPAQQSPQPKPVQPSYQPQGQKPPVAQTDMYAAPKKVEKTEPLSFWKFFGMLILQWIPIIGFIMILVWSFGSSFNRNTKNYARAVLVLGIISFTLIVAGFIVNFAVIEQILDAFGYTIDFGW